MNNKQKNNSKYQYIPKHILRENLRVAAAAQADRLARSVARQTSYDALPCPEYREEVAAEYRILDRLLYLQNCRAMLERCISSGGARLTYRWRSGRQTLTIFRMSASGVVKFQGLEL